ncbi:MAG: hypothetical protein RLZZ536_2527 [Planctomycetota bacterium]
MLLGPRNRNCLYSACRTYPCGEPLPSEWSETASHREDASSAPPHDPSSNTWPHTQGTQHGHQRTPEAKSASCSARPIEHPRSPSPDSNQPTDGNAETEGSEECLRKTAFSLFSNLSQFDRLPQKSQKNLFSRVSKECAGPLVVCLEIHQGNRSDKVNAMPHAVLPGDSIF